jgi:hypothetical protein
MQYSASYPATRLIENSQLEHGTWYESTLTHPIGEVAVTTCNDKRSYNLYTISVTVRYNLYIHIYICNSAVQPKYTHIYICNSAVQPIYTHIYL